MNTICNKVVEKSDEKSFSYQRGVHQPVFLNAYSKSKQNSEKGFYLSSNVESGLYDHVWEELNKQHKLED